MAHYSFNHFIGELEHGIPHANSQMDIIHTVAQSMQKLLGNDYLFENEYIRALRKGWTDGKIYESEHHKFVIYAFGWSPGVETPIHDHLTWGVMGIYLNQLQITEFSLEATDQKGVYDLQSKDKYIADRGSIAYIISPEDEIHHITNPSSDFSLSIHVYGHELSEYNVFDLEEGKITRIAH